MTAAPQSIGIVKTIDTGMSRNMGVYSDDVVIPPGMVQGIVSRTPALHFDGTQPEDITKETYHACNNVRDTLLCADAELGGIVQVRTWLTMADDIEQYIKTRNEIMGHMPAYMLALVPQLVRPTVRLTIEVVAPVTSTAPTASGRDE
jgi:enamine deaminase RidA (YjgF/YER057c/UK114 family)